MHRLAHFFEGCQGVAFLAKWRIGEVPCLSDASVANWRVWNKDYQMKELKYEIMNFKFACMNKKRTRIRLSLHGKFPRFGMFRRYTLSLSSQVDNIPENIHKKKMTLVPNMYRHFCMGHSQRLHYNKFLSPTLSEGLC